MSNHVTYSGNFDDGSLDVKIGNKYVLTVDLVELNQNSSEFQKGLLRQLVESNEDSFELGREYEKQRMCDFLNEE